MRDFFNSHSPMHSSTKVRIALGYLVLLNAPVSGHPLGRIVGISWKYLVVRKLPGWALLGRYPDDQRAEYADKPVSFSGFRYFFAF